MCWLLVTEQPLSQAATLRQAALGVNVKPERVFGHSPDQLRVGVVFGQLLIVEVQALVTEEASVGLEAAEVGSWQIRWDKEGLCRGQPVC